MKTRMQFWSIVAALVLGIAFVAAPAGFAQLNHLKCYTIDDSLPEGEVTLEVGNEEFGVETCTIRLPAQLLCVQTEKDSGTGADPRVTPAGNFLCYNTAASCRAGANLPGAQTFLLDDQFGERNVETTEASFARRFCAPAQIAP
jgi:hypothetical protein